MRENMATKRKRIIDSPAAVTMPAKDWTNICPHDGAPLIASGARRGFCEKADGYPLMRWFWHAEARQGKGAWEVQGWDCLFACEKCGHGLKWDGCCLSCGPIIGAPGDRYQRDRNHWRYERGPEPPMTPEQHARLLLRFKALNASLE